MRKLLSFWALLASVLLVASCTPDNPTPPDNNLTPEITLTTVDVSDSSFTFEITANEPCEYGYFYVSEFDSTPVPPIAQWFEANHGEVEDTSVVSISGLNANTTYQLYVAARSLADGELSAAKTVEFKTLDDGKYKPIEVLEVGLDYFSFRINIEGDYLFLPFETALLTMFGSPENYLMQKNYRDSGVKEFRWQNGDTYGYDEIKVSPNMSYTIVAAPCDSNGSITDAEGNITSEIYIIELTTKAKETSQAVLEITLSNITATSVDIKAVPDDTISTFYLFVLDAEYFHRQYEIAGEGAYMTVMKSGRAWSSSTTLERTWGDLEPTTVYALLKLIVDRSGAEAFSWEEFTTAAPSGPAPELEAELRAAAKDAYKTLELFIKTNGAAVKYAFATTADVDIERKYATDSEIIASRGIVLEGDDLAAATSNGVTLPMEDLWPETEYTAIVRALSSEKSETVTTLSFTTPAQPLPTRVESELFTSLIGEWEVSYSYRDVVGESSYIEGAKVRIAAGVDDYTNKHYRDLNRLVILDWPFQKHWASYDYTTNEPQHLAANNDYWKNNPNLAYRDYGPKIFLEIGDGDVISVPTSKNTYFYNERPNGGDLLHFYGTDLSNEQNAPCAFPVTLSADGNTLTIGACHSGAEYFYGVYRPAIWRDQEMRNVATTDIVLRRVK